MRCLLTLLGAAVLAGCATLDRDAPAVTYLVCGSAIRLDISHDGQRAIVRDSEGRETVLARVPSDLGVRYAGGGISVLRSGSDYVYNGPAGNTAACTRLKR